MLSFFSIPAREHKNSTGQLPGEGRCSREPVEGRAQGLARPCLGCGDTFPFPA